MTYSLEDVLSRLESENPGDRRVAMVMIGKARMHPLKSAVVEALQTDDDAEVRSMAAWSLDLIGDAHTVPALVEALYDPVFSVRSNAGWALVHLARRYVPQLVLPDVVDVLRDKGNPHAREMAYLVLANIHHPDSRAAIETYWR